MENRTLFDNLCVFYNIDCRLPYNVRCKELFQCVEQEQDYGRFIIMMDCMYCKRDYTLVEWLNYYDLKVEKEWMK